MLRQQVETLGSSLAALEGRVEKVGSDLDRAGSRVGALESRKQGERSTDAADPAALDRSLRDATRRIAELERQSGSGATASERIDALMTRMQRIESAQRSAPVPAAPAP